VNAEITYKSLTSTKLFSQRDVDHARKLQLATDSGTPAAAEDLLSTLARMSAGNSAGQSPSPPSNPAGLEPRVWECSPMRQPTGIRLRQVDTWDDLHRLFRRG
jgi:hypothetical protein